MCATTVGMTFEDAPIILVRNVQYDQVEGEALLLDAYYSPDADERPVVMLIHGGSWRRGDKADWARLAPEFVDAGYTVLVPNYRLAPPGGGTLFPGPTTDLSLALGWARSNVHLFGGDPARIGMLGSSAGGHLALLAGGAGDDRPDVVGAYSAPVNLRRLDRQGILRNHIRNFLGCRPRACPSTYHSADPANSVTTSSPPTFLAYSTEEMIPQRHGKVMSRRLADAGIPHTLHLRAGKAHGLGLARRSLNKTIAFLQRNL